MRSNSRVKPLAMAFAIAIGALGMGSLSACNTIAGAGQDLERGGEAVTGTARDTQRRM